MSRHQVSRLIDLPLTLPNKNKLGQVMPSGCRQTSSIARWPKRTTSPARPRAPFHPKGLASAPWEEFAEHPNTTVMATMCLSIMIYYIYIYIMYLYDYRIYYIAQQWTKMNIKLQNTTNLYPPFPLAINDFIDTDRKMCSKSSTWQLNTTQCGLHKYWPQFCAKAKC